jgi:hypothetical protein
MQHERLSSTSIRTQGIQCFQAFISDNPSEKALVFPHTAAKSVKKPDQANMQDKSGIVYKACEVVECTGTW